MDLYLTNTDKEIIFGVARKAGCDYDGGILSLYVNEQSNTITPIVLPNDEQIIKEKRKSTCNYKIGVISGRIFSIAFVLCLLFCMLAITYKIITWAL